MGDHNTKTEIVLFEDMIKLQCPVCIRELQWSMVLEEPVSKLADVASCCGIRYHARIHTMAMTNSKVDGDDPPSTMCRCGHEEVEHNRDTGCNISIGYHGVGGVLYDEKCSCWLYRKDG